MSACEKFRDFLTLEMDRLHSIRKKCEQNLYGDRLVFKYSIGMVEELLDVVGNICQTFDELHQSCCENTGDKCKVKGTE